MGRMPGRSEYREKADKEITMFKSLGIALEDLTAAKAIYEKGEGGDVKYVKEKKAGGKFLCY
jgi:ornithine cyclodeaminase/alanine dehydrogenase-like protein (mu-crystallin family)